MRQVQYFVPTASEIFLKPLDNFLGPPLHKNIPLPVKAALPGGFLEAVFCFFNVFWSLLILHKLQIQAHT